MITLQIILESSLCKILNTKENLIKYLSDEITKKIDSQYPQNKFFVISETIDLSPDFFGYIYKIKIEFPMQMEWRF